MEEISSNKNVIEIYSKEKSVTFNEQVTVKELPPQSATHDSEFAQDDEDQNEIMIHDYKNRMIFIGIAAFWFMLTFSVLITVRPLLQKENQQNVDFIYYVLFSFISGMAGGIFCSYLKNVISNSCSNNINYSYLDETAENQPSCCNARFSRFFKKPQSNHIELATVTNETPIKVNLKNSEENELAILDMNSKT